MIHLTLGYWRQISGMTSINKSIPFLYTKRLMTTMVTRMSLRHAVDERTQVNTLARGVGAEPGRVNGVGDDRDVRRREGATQHSVFFARITHTDDMCGIGKRKFEQLVGVNTGEVGETKESSG